MAKRSVALIPAEGISNERSGEMPATVNPSWQLPEFAFPVRAAGALAVVSMDDEYDPPVSSGRRKNFLRELDRLAEAEADEAISSAEVRF